MAQPGFPRKLSLVAAPNQSGERPAVTREAASLTRARLMYDNWDDRYGLLPPEPPREVVREDSVLLTLSDLPIEPKKPRYGTLSNVDTAALEESHLKQRLNTGLSCVAGYVDASGFVALAGFFPAHLTGELVSITTSPWGPGKSLAHNAYLLAGLFVLGVLASVLLARFLRKRSVAPYVPQLVLLTSTLCAVVTIGTLSAFNFQLLDFAGLAACALSFAMGIQNAVMRHALNGTLPTTVMTGNLTQFVSELVDLGMARLSNNGDPEKTHQTVHRVRVLGRTLLCFFGGAFVGALVTQRVGLLSMAIPTVMGAYLTYAAWPKTTREPVSIRPR
jgi:uncharacterized membrane protein YoaK (UPF0700 family)